VDLNIARRKMIDSQIRPNDVTDERVIQAFEKVQKENFVPGAISELAYSEVELETVEGRKLWLARDLSKMLQALEVKSDDLVLVVGAAEGYASALLNELADTVIALEENEEVVEKSSDRVVSLELDRIAFVKGSLKDGYPSEGPYDVIFVNGMVEYVPDAWLDQLSVGGRLGVVIGDERNGQARVYKKSAKAVSYYTEFECVPPKLPEIVQEKGFVF
tara:strand:+ start:93334 stop:93984 length:651 start_codon:yes stop_codon:yes gene_type:complete